jgi:hypothetical protein
MPPGMDLLLVAIMPVAGIVLLLVTAFMTLPAGAGLATVSRLVAARGSRELRDLEIGLLSFDEAAIQVSNGNLQKAA